jgi:cell wall-associated NlpC family hydrolase
LQNAAAIINAGIAMNIDVHGQEIGVMTAMDETGLHNDDDGDAAGPDSRGLFQQRTSWGTLVQRMNPTTAATLFFHRMLTVANWEDLAPTVVAHTVQVNADPNTYTKFWGAAQDVVTGLQAHQVCTDSASAADISAAGDPGPNGTGGGGFAPDTDQVATAIAYAESQLGKPYVFGGLGNPGWDCSGLTMFSYLTAGITIGSHSVSAQLATMEGEGRILPYADAERGDLLFWQESDGTYEHVAIYLGGGMMIAAPQTGEDVMIQKVWSTSGEHLLNVVGRPTGTP